MTHSLGSIGELFPDKNIRCRVRGCTNSWQMAGEDAVRKLASADPELPERMCAECYETYIKLKDMDVACGKNGCANTWKWTRFQQLEALAKGITRPPRRFCPDCQKELAEIADKEMPCRMKGCKGSWVWSKQQQLNWDKDQPPSRLCKDCFTRLQEYEDKQLPCRVKGCGNRWPWSAYQQLEHALSGKDPENSPRRMCPDCVRRLRQYQDMEVPCKARECSRTWTWSAYAQLEFRLTHGDEAPPPTRLCNECFQFFQQARDIERQCKTKGCRRTWIYGKGWQLRDWLKGREYAPAMICEECRARLEQLAPVEKPCDVPGCSGTWTHLPEEQLKDSLSGRRDLRSKRCKDCEEFLHEHTFQNVKCEKCGCDVPWSPYEQLLVTRGIFTKPALCSACGGANLPASRPPLPVVSDHHQVVRMPKGGRWGSDPEIAAWPPHLDHAVIARAEKADIRIVALGDDLTYSADDIEHSWPLLLERKLAEKLADQGLVPVVVNAGIPGTSSRQALQRLKRDVAPFKPHIILFSFAFGDSLLEIVGDRYRPKISDEEAEQAMAQLNAELRKTGAKAIYWTTNPTFPHCHKQPVHLNGWADAQQARKSHMLAHALRLCGEAEIPVVELRSRFEVNGESSAKKWMSDWFNHNATGAANIATWMASELATKFIDAMPEK